MNKTQTLLLAAFAANGVEYGGEGGGRNLPYGDALKGTTLNPATMFGMATHAGGKTFYG